MPLNDTPLPQAASRVEEIDLRKLALILWRAKWLILATTFVMAAVALGVSLLVTERYEATVIVAAVSKESGGLSSSGAALSELGGLASLVGISVPGSDLKAEAIATLQSEALTERYIREHKLLPLLFASKWDASRNAWKVTDPKKMPTLWKGNEYFKNKIRTVTDDRKTGLVTLAITWTDPVVAATWANQLVDLTNDHLREKALHEAELNIAYLNDQAEKAKAIEVKQTIYTLLQGEIKRAMLAQGTREYALKVIDPAVAPERPSSPKVLIWTILGFLAGGLLSSVWVVARAGNER